MELHISSDDVNYMTDLYEYAEDGLDTVDGYVSINGRDRNGKLNHIVQINRSSIGNQFPKRVTFGQMLDMLKSVGSDELYFQREDWRGKTHNCVALNKQNSSELFLEIYYEDERYNKDYKPKYRGFEIPMDSHPYIPTYADMFQHSWVVYRDEEADIIYEGNEDKEKDVNNCAF